MSKRPLDHAVLGLIGILVLLAAELLPLRALAATQLRWQQSGTGRQGFVVYFGQTQGVYTGYRDIGYIDPGSDGISTYPLAGLITQDSWVAMEAYYEPGQTSSRSNAVRVIVSCNTNGDCAVPQQCQVGICASQVGCTTQNVPDGTSCDDGDANTTGETCRAGQCVNTAPPGTGGTVDITQIVPGSPSGRVGTSTSFVVSATSTGMPLYRWLVMPLSSGNWTILRDYTYLPIVSWTPQAPGQYRIAVSAKTTGAAQEQDWHAIDFSVAPAPPPAEPVAPMAEITVDTSDAANAVLWRVPAVLEAAAGTGLEYRFSLFVRGRPRRVLRDYSDDPRFVWLPLFRPGTYELGVEVRNAGERTPWGVDTTNVEIVAEPFLDCSDSGGVISCSTPPSGGELEYQWLVRAPRTRWQVLHSFGEMGDSISFTPNNGSGTYWVSVRARPAPDSALPPYRSVYTYTVRINH